MMNIAKITNSLPVAQNVTNINIEAEQPINTAELIKELSSSHE